jgi:DtxR family Mn-dependent transcriptional regulator
MFSEFFYKLGVPKDIATRDACKIEHAVSKTTFNAIKSFVQKHSGELNSNNE